MHSEVHIILYDPFSFVFFFQAEDGIRDLVRSRGLGDVYKRQVQWCRCKVSENKTERKPG